jgi:hypothetical protein
MAQAPWWRYDRKARPMWRTADSPTAMWSSISWGARSFSLVETESTRWSDYDWGRRQGSLSCLSEGGALRRRQPSDRLPSEPPVGPGNTRWDRTGAGGGLAFGDPWSIRDSRSRAGRSLSSAVCRRGSWIEANGLEDCLAYGPKGEPLGKVGVRGDWPTFEPRARDLEFVAESEPDVVPRAKIVIFADGAPL